MPKTTKKVLEDEDILEKTRERVDYLFETYEEIFIAVSGGKDSMSVHNVIMDGIERHADEDSPTPVHLILHDNETPYPETVELFERIADRRGTDVKVWWCILPMTASLMTTTNQTWLNPWDERRPEDWVRPMPTWEDYDNVEVVRPDHPYMENFKVGDQHVDVAYHIIEHYMDDHDLEREDVIQLVGLRAEESMNRYTTILQLEGFIQQEGNKAPCHIGHPVYDWSTDDLWALHDQEDWDYNKAYDKFHQLGIAPSKARNGNPWGTYPIRAQKAKNTRHFWPERFEKWERRYEGAHLAFDFGYDMFDIEPDKPEDETWREYCARLVNSFEDADEREKEKNLMEDRLERHWERSNVPLKEEEECPVCGLSWREIARDLNEKLNDHYIHVH